MTKKTNAQLAAENEALRKDLTIIAQMLKDEAVDREWCDEYGEFVEMVNERTSEAHLLLPEAQTFTVVLRSNDYITSESVKYAIERYLNVQSITVTEDA